MTCNLINRIQNSTIAYITRSDALHTTRNLKEYLTKMHGRWLSVMRDVSITVSGEKLNTAS